MIREAQATARSRAIAASAAGSSARVHARRGGALRGRHRQEHQAPLRDRARRQGRERARHPDEDLRRHRATSSRWARAASTSSQTNAKNLELVLRSGALPAPISPSNEQRIGPSLGQDAIEAGPQGRRSRARPRAHLHGRLLQPRGAHREHRRHLQPGPADRDPGDVRRLDDAARHRGPRAHDRHRRRRERPHQRAHPRGAAARQERAAAVDVGYDKAFSAILDGHVTTLISGLILAQYGTGPIKGFAITLIVGIAVSLFTGVVCTRLMFDWAVRGSQSQEALRRLRTGDNMEFIKPGTQFDFMGKRWYFIGVSAVPSAPAPIDLVHQARPEARYGLQGRHGGRGPVQAADVDAGEGPRAPSRRLGFEAPDVLQIDDTGAVSAEQLHDPRSGGQRADRPTEASHARAHVPTWRKGRAVARGQVPRSEHAPARSSSAPVATRSRCATRPRPISRASASSSRAFRGVETPPRSEQSMLVASERDHKVEIAAQVQG
jgi:hypothetical protein